MVLVFSREGPVEEYGAAEELAEAPEATWQDSQVLRILSEQLRTLEEQERLEELAVRA